MNRRSFLKIVAATSIAPTLTLAEKSASEHPDDPFEILSPDEIKKHFGHDRYVPAPCFRYGCVKNGKLDFTPYLVKAHRLHGVLSHSQLHPKSDWIACAQKLAKEQINQLQITHIHSVRLSESTVITSCGDHIHFMVVRGAKVKL
jgi:hypothetical protein